MLGWEDSNWITLRERLTFNQGINEIDKRELGDESRVKFYQELSRNSLNKIWEVVTFREFLMDRCSNDEIYFYLHYRNLIF